MIRSKQRRALWDSKLLTVWLTAPAKEGKANRQLLEYLSKLLALPKTSIKIVHGDNARHKLVKIDLDSTSLNRRLKPLEGRMSKNG